MRACARLPRSRRRGARRVEYREEIDGIAGGAELAGHLEGDDPAEGVAAEPVRTIRAHGPHRGDVAPRQGLDAAIGRAWLLEAEGLDRVHIVVLDRVGEPPQRDHGAAATGNAEERRTGGAGAQRDHERRARRPALRDPNRELLDGRRLEHGRRGQLDAELVGDRGEQLDDAERVATQLEEVVVESDPFQSNTSAKMSASAASAPVGLAVRRRRERRWRWSAARSSLLRRLRGSASRATKVLGTIVVGTRVATSRRSLHVLSGTDPFATT